MRRHPATPASFLITVQDDLWIQTVRALNMRAMSFEGFLAGATSTRSGPGKPIRWADGWLSALEAEWGVDNLTRQKNLTKQRAEYVRKQVLL